MGGRPVVRNGRREDEAIRSFQEERRKDDLGGFLGVFLSMARSEATVAATVIRFALAQILAKPHEQCGDLYESGPGIHVEGPRCLDGTAPYRPR